MDEIIAAIMEDLDPADLVPSLADYVKNADFQSFANQLQTRLGDTYTKDEIDTLLDAIEAGTIDLSAYATKAEIADMVTESEWTTRIDALTDEIDAIYATGTSVEALYERVDDHINGEVTVKTDGVTMFGEGTTLKPLYSPRQGMIFSDIYDTKPTGPYDNTIIYLVNESGVTVQYVVSESGTLVKLGNGVITLTDYYTKSQVDDQIDTLETDLVEMEQALAEVVLEETDPVWAAEKANYALKSELPSLDGMVSDTELAAYQSALAGTYVRKTELSTAINTILEANPETDPVWTAEKSKYATTNYVDGEIAEIINNIEPATNTVLGSPDYENWTRLFYNTDLYSITYGAMTIAQANITDYGYARVYCRFLCVANQVDVVLSVAVNQKLMHTETIRPEAIEQKPQDMDVIFPVSPGDIVSIVTQTTSAIPGAIEQRTIEFYPLKQGSIITAPETAIVLGSPDWSKPTAVLTDNTNVAIPSSKNTEVLRYVAVDNGFIHVRCEYQINTPVGNRDIINISCNNNTIFTHEDTGVAQDKILVGTSIVPVVAGDIITASIFIEGGTTPSLSFKTLTFFPYKNLPLEPQDMSAYATKAEVSTMALDYVTTEEDAANMALKVDHTSFEYHRETDLTRWQAVADLRAEVIQLKAMIENKTPDYAAQQDIVASVEGSGYTVTNTLGGIIDFSAAYLLLASGWIKVNGVEVWSAEGLALVVSNYSDSYEVKAGDVITASNIDTCRFTPFVTA
jgi:hypothetical protein